MSRMSKSYGTQVLKFGIFFLYRMKIISTGGSLSDATEKKLALASYCTKSRSVCMALWTTVCCHIDEYTASSIFRLK
jgi:hypothetical protein